jgi:hypothetical protein
MQSFKTFVLLVENRIEFLKKNNPDISTEHDSLANYKDPSDIIDHFASADPHPQKAYTQWVLNQYKRKNIRQEDAPRVNKTLSDFHVHKGKLQNKDINSYNRISELEDAIKPHLDKPVSKKAEKRQIKHEGADLIHDDKELGVTVHHIKTKAASCHYGKGTKWCTSGEKDNSFDDYIINYNNDDSSLLETLNYSSYSLSK